MKGSKEQLASVELEIAGEKAHALGRIARRMEKALDELRRFDAGGEAALEREPEAPPIDREELAAVAAEWLWYYIVQREVMGWHRHEEALRMYDVPAEVAARMGPRRRS